MKALVYNGARDVSVSEVPDATIEHPKDVVIKLTTTNICGSDLHMFEGRTAMEEGRVLGHENMGEVVEIVAALAANAELLAGAPEILPADVRAAN